MSFQPYSVTDNYSVYVKRDGVVIYDTRIEKHRPIFLKGDEAEEFKQRLESLAISINNDDEYEKLVESLCEEFRKP